MTGRLLRHLPALLALLLAASVVALYWPAAGFDFVLYDDDRYVQDNPAVWGGLGASGVREAFTGMGNWMFIPLTWLSLATDVELWGHDPGAMHRTNILLFSLSAGILLLVLFRATGSLWPSAFAAALFALHPLRVESVAWIVERKDVLCLFFTLLALAAWLRFVRSRSTAFYLLALFLFACALLSKPVAVSFPLLLLVLDFWPLGRGRGSDGQADPPDALKRWALLAREKIPFFLLSLAISLSTLILHPGAGQGWEGTAGVLSRLQAALVSPLVYLRKTAWPDDLALRHLVTPPPADWRMAAAAAAVLLLTLVAFRLRRRHPFLLAGWLWYLAALIPVGGLVQTGVVWVADRFTLLPHLGLAAAVAWGAASLLPKKPAARATTAILAVFLLLSLAVAARAQLAHWRDTGALMTRALSFSPDVALFHNNLGVFLGNGGDEQAAVGEFRLAVLHDPDDAMHHFNLGRGLMKLGRGAEAIPFLQEAVRLAPGDGDFRLKLGIALMEEGKAGEAAPHLEEFVRTDIDPALLRTARSLLARAYLLTGRRSRAIATLEQALSADPLAFTLRLELAELLLAEGRRDEAVAHWQEVADRAPEGAAETLFASGRLQDLMGRKQEAAAFYRRAEQAPALDEGFPAIMKGMLHQSGGAGGPEGKGR